MAQERAHENISSLQKDLDTKRARSSVHIKQEPGSDKEDEPMDTTSPSSSSIPNGSVNGHPSTTSPNFDHTNGNTPSPELQDFVTKTFRKHFVLTLNELKRLFNLHLASMPAGWSVFQSVSDHVLQDAMLLCRCKQIMVPVSIHAGGNVKDSQALWMLNSKSHRMFSILSLSLCLWVRLRLFSLFIPVIEENVELGVWSDRAQLMGYFHD